MLVAQIIKSKGDNVVTIERKKSIRDAADLLTKHNIGAVLVRDESGICGILSERDVARGLSHMGGSIADATVETQMTRDVLTCALDDQTHGLLDLMTERRIRHLPVKADGEIVGIVSIGDIVKARLDELERQSEAMQTYIAGTG